MAEDVKTEKEKCEYLAELLKKFQALKTHADRKAFYEANKELGEKISEVNFHE